MYSVYMSCIVMSDYVAHPIKGPAFIERDEADRVETSNKQVTNNSQKRQTHLRQRWNMTDTGTINGEGRLLDKSPSQERFPIMIMVDCLRLKFNVCPGNRS